VVSLAVSALILLTAGIVLALVPAAASAAARR
jgi:hypothetical protein